jgi:hypothetical protein
MISTALRAFYVGIAAPKVYGVYSAIMAIVNIILDIRSSSGTSAYPKWESPAPGWRAALPNSSGSFTCSSIRQRSSASKSTGCFRFVSFKKNLVVKTLELSATVGSPEI